MFSKDYWYIGALTAVLIAMEVFAVLFLAKRKWLSRIVLWTLTAYLLATQIVDLARNKTFYLAFSTIAYWLVIVGVLVPWRPLKSLSASFGLIAGVVYLAGFLVYPEMMTHQGQFGIGYMNGYLIHDILIVNALLMYTQFEVKRYDAAVIGGGIAVIVVLTELGQHVFRWGTINAFLLGMIEGTVIKDEIFPNLPLAWWWYILWYIIVLAALWGIWELIRLLNRRLYSRQNEASRLVW